MKKLIVANWKMNPASQREAQKMFLALKTGLRNNKAEVVICPPFVYIPLALEIFGASSFARRKASFGGLAFGSQNCFWEEQGAFTGEISPKMLKDFGVKYVILGHSERIITVGETNEMTAKKVKAVLRLGLTPIVCIGETAREREDGKAFQVLEQEFRESLASITRAEASKIVIAYEPLWAISTNQGKDCSPDDALTAVLFFRQLLMRVFGKKASHEARILYGGSANSQNAVDYLEHKDIDGLLVGGASLEMRDFLKIVTARSV